MVNAIVGYVRRHHVALLALFMAMNGTPLTIGVVTEVVTGASPGPTDGIGFSITAN